MGRIENQEAVDTAKKIIKEYDKPSPDFATLADLGKDLADWLMELSEDDLKSFINYWPK
jgi:hypothetical protein